MSSSIPNQTLKYLCKVPASYFCYFHGKFAQFQRFVQYFVAVFGEEKILVGKVFIICRLTLVFNGGAEKRELAGA
jgi:hypothetical protein